MNPPQRTIADIDAEVAGEQSQIRGLFNRLEKLEEALAHLESIVQINTIEISDLYGKVR